MNDHPNNHLNHHLSLSVKTPHLYALILAGGGGTRLWPLSRKGRPKQMVALTEHRTLFQITAQRLEGLMPPDRIYVATGQEMAETMHESAPEIPKENFILEPSGRDSGPAAGLGIYHIAQRDPEAVIAILSADHYIADEDHFKKALHIAHDVAQEGNIVTLGIEPYEPATGFGYIERGVLLHEMDGFKVYRAERFTEKPDVDTARAFLDSGVYSWNAGIFIMTAAQAKEEFSRQRPQMHKILERLTAYPAEIDALWEKIEKISIDFAIMEKARHMAIVPVDFGWSDVGTWAAVYNALPHDENGNAFRSEENGHLAIDASRNLYVGDKMVVTIGVEDLVIVDTPDALLICHRDRAQEVKQIVEQLKVRADMRL